MAGAETGARGAESFGLRLRRRRKALDLTQEQLAERAYCSPGAIRKLESDARRPSLQLARQLAEILEAAPEDREAFVRLARLAPPAAPTVPGAPGAPGAPAVAAPPEAVALATGPAPVVRSAEGDGEDGERAAPVTPRAGPLAPAWRPRESLLPSDPHPLLGREDERRELCRRLGRADVRLLTLTGTGGTGKTRLALAVAADMEGHFADGVVFVELATLSESRLVMPAIAAALGLREDAGQGVLGGVIGDLRSRFMLLILDNLEQVLPAATELAEIVRRCPRVKILATSRAALRLRGEHEFPVQPLPLPDEAIREWPDPCAALRSPAVALFVARAREVAPHFALDTGNVAAVASICRRLDGLPLAIELAAARIRALSPQALLALQQGVAGRGGPREVADPPAGGGLQLLTGGARDVPRRQRTLRATLDWSYQLLEPHERVLFARLGIFAGGCTLEAVATVAADAPSADGPGLLDGVESLIAKSLLARSAADAQGEPRYAMLHVVREYALERLAERGELAEIGRRHTSYVLRLAERAEPELRRERQGFWLDYLWRELDNVRAALERTLANDEAETGLRIASALKRLWEMRGYLGEARRTLERLLELDARGGRPAADAVRAKALGALGRLVSMQGDDAVALGYLRQGLTLYRQLGDSWGLAESLDALGGTLTDLGDYAGAAAALDESSALSRGLGDGRLLSSALNNRAGVAHYQGDQDLAIALAEESLALKRAIGDHRGVATILCNVGEALCARGEVARAAALFAETVAMWRALGDREGLALSVEGLALVAGARGHARRAALLLAAADAARGEVGAPLRAADRAAHGQQLSALRDRIGDAEYAAAWAEGQLLTIEQAANVALDEATAT